MLTYILLILIAVIAIFCIIAARQPDEFRVTRNRLLNAPAEIVFAHVNDLGKWRAWSPWARMEPEANSTFEGPKAGVGAKFSWEGKKTGQGSMTITESRPYEWIRFRLDLLKPMKATNTAEFNFSPEGQQTRVTWSMYGTNNFMNKIVGLAMNCEKMVGAQFDDGLSYLEEIVANESSEAA